MSNFDKLYEAVMSEDDVELGITDAQPGTADVAPAAASEETELTPKEHLAKAIELLQKLQSLDLIPDQSDGEEDGEAVGEDENADDEDYEQMMPSEDNEEIATEEIEAEEAEMPADEKAEDVEDVENVEDKGDEIDLEELLAELDAMGDQDENEGMYEAKKKKEDKDDKDEMKEAIDTIETLRNELNEVNLLNAKLLYVNKIFKAKNLNESQKLKVIAQFDKATTAKEAKAIFESMNNAIAKSAKSTIKESLGFASKAAGVAPKKPIVDETMSRWQMLAGITKF